MNRLDKYTRHKYAIGLDVSANSFYDPLSRINLFKSNPVIGFDIEPTKNIVEAVKAGTLIDLKGNIVGGNKAADVDIEAIKKEAIDSIDIESIKAEAIAEVSKEKAEVEEQLAKAQEEIKKLKADLKKEKAKNKE